MDRFAAVSDAGGLVMGYYHTAGLPLAADAANYTLCDNFFHAAFGGSFLNHMWLVAAQNAAVAGWHAADGGPRRIKVTSMDAAGTSATARSPPTATAVNTAYSVNAPALKFPARPCPGVPNLRPCPTSATACRTRASSWAWYSGGWNDALAGHADPLFQFHHQPFAYFARYADGTAGQGGAPEGRDGLHRRRWRPASCRRFRSSSRSAPTTSTPATPTSSRARTRRSSLINAIRNGPHWKHTAIIVTYDEHGGFWDHVRAAGRRSLGPGRARADARHLALRAKALRRPHRRTTPRRSWR